MTREKVKFAGKCLGGRAVGKRHASWIYVFKVNKIIQGDWDPAKNIIFEVFHDFGGKELNEKLKIEYTKEDLSNVLGMELEGVGDYFNCSDKQFILEVEKSLPGFRYVNIYEK